MLHTSKMVNECEQAIDVFLQHQSIPPQSKKRFPVDGDSLGVVYQLGHFGIEVTVHQFIIFSKFNSRYIDMNDYRTSQELLDFTLPLIQEYIDDPDITKHLFIRQLNKLKGIFSLSGKS